LIYTFGFLSIIAFTALIGQASYVILVIVDDFFRQIRLGFLTRGLPTVLIRLFLLSITFWSYQALPLGTGQDPPGEFTQTTTTTLAFQNRFGSPT
jgi:hypothetical protein